MQNSVPALLRLSARPRYWRIAIILPGRILWRTYSREECQTPDDAVRRCLAGLLLPGSVQPQTVHHDEATQHPRPLRPVRIRAAWWGWL
jgi:hypothetical protein